MASQENNISTTVDGVRAIELFYRPIKETAGNNTIFYQSQIRFNAPSMGVLMPSRYLSVFESSMQSVRIFELAFHQFLKALSKFSERGALYDWISIYMPINYLKKTGCAYLVSEMCKKALVRTERVCFELSPTIFNQADINMISAIKELTDMGFHVMITGIGGDCPILKLGEFSPDYVMLAPYAAAVSPDDDRSFTCLKSIVHLCDELNIDSIICDIKEKSQLKMVKELECAYYTGKLSGTFMAEKYVRAKNSNEKKDNTIS